MEKQGVYFSEQAWRDFLEFLNQRDATPPEQDDDIVDNKEVDKLVRAYEKRQEQPARSVTDDIVDILKTNGKVMRAQHIGDAIRKRGHDLENKAMTHRIRVAMNHDSNIQQVGRGQYAYVLPEPDSIYKGIVGTMDLPKLKPGPERGADIE